MMESTRSNWAEPAQDRTRRQVRLVEIIRRSLSAYGYIELNLPVYEHYNLLKETAYDFSDENIIRFVDRNTGKTLVLRPDFTPQVCRAVTGYMNDYPLPLRLFYSGEVFRTVDGDRGRKTEKYQIGWELFGGGELCGDMEMFLSASRALKAVGLKGYTFVVGDAIFLQRMFSLAGNAGTALKSAVAGKKRHDMENILECCADLPVELKNLLFMLPISFGRADIINVLKSAASFDKILSRRLDYISELFSGLVSLGADAGSLVFDASETRGLGYYTGVNFDIVHSAVGFSLGGGGRYDNLMDKFGRPLPACGAALYISELMRFGLCADDGQHFDWLVSGWENLKKAEELRNVGESVFFVADGEEKDAFMKVYRFKNVIG